jgi:hypothetical protein
MKRAYMATGEYAELICAYDKNPGKALKRIAKLVNKMTYRNQNTMLTSINIGYDDDGHYNVTATISTTL